MSKKKAQRASANGKARRYEFEIASREDLAAVILAAGRALTHEQIAHSFAIYAENEKFIALGRRLNAMVRDGQLVRNRRGAFLPVDEENFLRGRISAHPDGFGFLVNERGGDDIYLAAGQMRRVLDGDRVVVQVTGVDRRGRSEGAIVEVLERANQFVVGRFRVTGGVGLLVPDNKRLHQQIVIDGPGAAKDGQIVVAEILEQPTNRQPPIGRISEVLGEHLSPGMEIDIAIRAHNIPAQWPAAVIEQSVGIADSVDPAVIGQRRDLRKLPLVTIDGADARDFDDAVYAEKKDYGYRLLVAIADVSHYVEVDTALDLEALNRGTSVYFPQQVIPMLPEKLSNGLCSLNPNVDRLCMVCDMAINHDGSLRRSTFYPATMRSQARLTYQRVYDFLLSAGLVTGSRGANRAAKKAFEDAQKHGIDASLQPHLRVLYELYGALRSAREARGAIDFDSSETQIVFNAERKIESLKPLVRNDAHLLIEECMISANIAAARFLGRKKVPGLYRIHERPGAEKLEDVRKFLQQRGLSLGGGDHPQASDYAQTLQSAADRVDVQVVQTVLLRSMNRAVYSTSNHGHFGLALEEYAHFTSPIRRYPDLMVHRAIKHMLVHKQADSFDYSAARVAQIGEHCSTVEHRAEQAVRDVVAWLKCEYVQDHVGTEFTGVITAVTSFGLFVELSDIHVEGLIHISSLPQDYYDFDSVRHRLLGRHSGQAFELGQVLSAKVVAVNLDERKIDLQLAGGASAKPKQRRRSKPDLAIGARSDGRSRRRQGAKAATPEDSSSNDTGDKKRKRTKGGKSRHKRAQVAAASDLNQEKKGEKVTETKRRPTRKPAKLAISVDDSAASLAGDLSVVKPPSGRKPVGVKNKAAGKAANEDHVVAESAPPAPAKKTTKKKASSKKTASKKTASKKTAGKKTASKKTASKKALRENTDQNTTDQNKADRGVVAKKSEGKKSKAKVTQAKRVTSKKAKAKKLAQKPTQSQAPANSVAKVRAKAASGKKRASSNLATKTGAGHEE